ncbi:MAG: hypothetical protein JNK15_16760, partial [Planctomycetes bacterium]|nr:hypothetical protein [Planctomycetota bacterium]
MVIRTVVSGARAVPGHRSRSLKAPLVAAGFVFASFATAQSGTPPAATPTPAPVTTPTGDAATPPPKAQDPAAAPAPAATPASAQTFARVVNDKVALRCWAGAVASPPVFEETLAKDTVVAVGRSENGFRAVQLPLGPLGFVSKKFTETSPEGLVKTKGSKVAFRYRARSSEAPVAQLDDGTTLQVVGEQDDWFRVRVAG